MKTLLVTIFALTFAATSAHAGFYLRGGLLYNSPRDISIAGISQDFRASIGDTAGFNLAGGYQLPFLRLEAELNHMDSSIRDTEFAEAITSGDFRRTSYFANALLEYPFTPIIQPYLGVGVGTSRFKTTFANEAIPGGSETSFSSRRDASRFSYQLMAGLRLSFFETLSIYTGYRYLNTDGLTLIEGDYFLKMNTGAHLFELGAGFGF